MLLDARISMHVCTNRYNKHVSFLHAMSGVGCRGDQQVKPLHTVNCFVYGPECNMCMVAMWRKVKTGISILFVFSYSVVFALFKCKIAKLSSLLDESLRVQI